MSELKPVAEASDLALAEEELLSSASASRLAYRATLLDERAYRAVVIDRAPFKRGAGALLFAVGMAALARLLGIALGVMTLPRLDVVQEQILRAITDTAYYAQMVAQNPQFAQSFNAGYAGLWEAIIVVGGYPSLTGLAGSLTWLLLILLSWLVYGTAVHVLARWFGTDVDYGRTLGVLALAYTPILLTVVEAIPGANVPYLLIFALILIAKFLAIKSLYQMGPGQNLALLVLPYLIGLILLITLLLFAAALGLNQFPIVDDLLRSLRFANTMR